MLPLVIAGLIWGYNAVKIAQLASRKNRLQNKEPDGEEKNFTIFNNCTFEDKRTYHYYNNCVFNTYIIKGSKDKESFE